MNETVQDVEGLFLKLGKPKDEGGRIPTLLYFNNKKAMFGYIMKDKDVEGELYKFVLKWEMSYIHITVGSASKDSAKLSRKIISTSIKNLKEIKFRNHHGELTIIAPDPNTTLLFKRFVRERPHYEIPEIFHLLA